MGKPEEREFKYRINEYFAKTKGTLGAKDKALADAVGMSERYIKKVRLISADSVNAINTDLLIKISLYFGCSPNDLLNHPVAVAA